MELFRGVFISGMEAYSESSGCACKPSVLNDFCKPQTRRRKPRTKQNDLIGVCKLTSANPCRATTFGGLAASACRKTVCNTLAVAEGFKVLAGGSSPGKTLAILSAAAGYL